MYSTYVIVTKIAESIISFVRRLMRPESSILDGMDSIQGKESKHDRSDRKE